MLRDYLTNAAHKYPDRPAVKIRNTILSYRELSGQAQAMAHALRNRGIPHGARVALWLPKELEVFIAIHGVLAAGCVYVPIDLAAPPQRVMWIAKDAAAEVLICRKADAEQIAAVLPQSVRVLILVGESGIETASRLERGEVIAWPNGGWQETAFISDGELSRDAEQLAYVLYTSGSTGTPKGVAISHRAAMAFVDWSAALCALQPEDRVANHAAVSFDLSIFDIFSGAKAGACLCPVANTGLASGYMYARFIEDEAITVWYSVPTVLSRIVQQQEARPFNLGSLRLVIFAGEAYPKVGVRQLRSALPQIPLYNWYGPTETNVCTWHRVEAADLADDGSLPIGKACPYASIEVLDDGEAVVRGASLLSGYMQEGKVDASILRGEDGEGGGYRTGDYLSLREDGIFLYHGRRDAQFKRHGYRIEAGEIEELARALPGVQNAAVILAQDQIILYVASHAGDCGEAVRSWLSAHVAHYMIPDEIVTLRELPSNERGKLDRKLLHAMSEEKYAHA